MFVAGARPHVEHIYESPKFERREFVPPPASTAAAQPGHGGARECICYGPPPQAAPAPALGRCVHYLDAAGAEQNAASQAAQV